MSATVEDEAFRNGLRISHLARKVLLHLESEPDGVSAKLTALATAAGALLATSETDANRYEAMAAVLCRMVVEEARWGAGYLQREGRVS